MSVITDRKRGYKTLPANALYDYYLPAVVSASDYYAFGLEMRTFNTGGYRYGFNGKENDRGNFGGQLVQDYGMRLYNPASGRFLSVDPIARQYPELTPYQFASNTPIQAIDLDGLEGASVNKQTIFGVPVVLSVRTENTAGVGAAQWDRKGLTQIGIQQKETIHMKQQQATYAKVMAKQPVIKADKRTPYQKEQGAKAIRQMAIEEQIKGRQELDPVGAGAGKMLSEGKTWVAAATVVLPEMAAGHVLQATASVRLANVAGGATDAVFNAGNQYVTNDYDWKQVDGVDVGMNFFFRNTTATPWKQAFQNIVAKNAINATFDLNGQDGFTTLGNGKAAKKILYDFGTGVTKDATMQKLGISMEKAGVDAGIQTAINRATDFSIDVLVKKNEPKSEPKN